MKGRDLHYKDEVIQMVKLWEKESQQHSEESLKRSSEISQSTELGLVALKMAYPWMHLHKFVYKRYLS